MINNFIVVRNNRIIKVYQSSDGMKGVEKALEYSRIGASDVTVFEKLDTFQYAVGDMIYPYAPTDIRPTVLAELNPNLKNEAVNVE